MTALDYDLIIAGAGLAGNCLGLALRHAGLKIAIVEAASRRELHDSSLGERALALSAGTVQLLQRLQIWQGVADKATPIKQIHVSDRGHFGKTRLAAAEQGVEALGYVIVARDLEDHVAAMVAESSLNCWYDTRLVGLVSANDAVNVCLKQQGQSINLCAQLLVGADGGQSSVRKLLEIPQHVTDYGQTALVTTVHSSLPHQYTAYERFTEFGPLALLPVAAKESSVVWTRSHEQAQALLAGGEADFLAELQACFGYRLGTLRLTAPRRGFPLSLIRAESMVCGRTVIVGNAVHQLHPVAGQGFNLGMRDVAALAEILLTQKQHAADLAEVEVLQRYQQQRQRDHDQTIGFTNGLVRVFSNDWLAMAAARNLGLMLLDHTPVVRRLLAKHAMGLADPLPEIGAR